MELPQELRAALLAADEEYLIALCNKGTVNRAKKDLSSAQPEVRGTDGAAVTLTVGDSVCTIAAPLGNSTCSCPSSAMCRHRMAAILWLKEQAAQAAPPPGEAAAPAADTPPEEKAEELTALLSAYPTQTLTRQLGERRVSALIQRERLGPGADIREGSTVAVDLPWIPATIRLIAPLEHSSCTCHSRSFCLHKAEALLTWQLRHGIVTADTLLPTLETAGQDSAGRRAVCAAVQDALTDWLRTGLSRLPPSSQDTAERLAGLCHTGSLPTLERAMRRLHGDLQHYFGRSAAFRPELLLRRMGENTPATHTGELYQPPFLLNLTNRTLEKNGERVKLTQIEYAIVKLFMENSGKALAREEILDAVWGKGYFGELKIVDVNVRRLRLKIEDDAQEPKYISTVWGFGYKWTV